MTFDFSEEIRKLESVRGRWPDDAPAQPGKTVLDQLHQSMIFFGSGNTDALKRFLTEARVGHNPLYWRLAQALSGLYSSGTEEKRWVDGVLACKKRLGFRG